MTVIKVNGLNLRREVAAAQQAAADATDQASLAETARTAAEALVISDLGTTDGQTRALIEAPASQTAVALSATFAPERTAVDCLHRGRRRTGALTAPSSSRLTSGTSGATYTSANWQTVATSSGHASSDRTRRHLCRAIATTAAGPTASDARLRPQIWKTQLGGNWQIDTEVAPARHHG